jgi:hypothetical protein
MYCIGECFPPKSAFLFWDLITGGAPVNDYSILGYQMLTVAYTMLTMAIPMTIFLIYTIYKLYKEWKHQ